MTIAAAALVAALALPLLLGGDSYYLYLLGVAALWASLASAWALLAWAGPVSFGHAAFFGGGAYTSALLTQAAGVPAGLALAAAALAGALLAVPMGLASHRLSGAYLAVATLAYAEACRLAVLNWTSLTGGGAGLVGIPPLGAGGEGRGGRAGEYYLALGLLVVTLALAAGLRRTRVGLAWAALRQREARARLLGIAPTRYRLLAFVCSGALTGAAGALYAHAVRFLEPDLVFGAARSLAPLVMATFGGAHALFGPAVGALLLSLVSELVFARLAPRLHQLPYALALIAVVLYVPRGLAGLPWRR